MHKILAQKILEETKATYDQIANDFSTTRSFVWPEIEDLKKYLWPGTKVLDLGCGNGRLYQFLQGEKISYTGIDSSKNLIRIAQKKYPKAKFIVGDALRLPFADQSFDLIFSIAVFHQIPSFGLRRAFLLEAKRILKKDGRLILTVWHLWQKKYLKIALRFTLLKILGKNKLDWLDIYLPWQKKEMRYYHIFSRSSLKKAFLNTHFKIEKMWYLKRGKMKTNLCVVAQKK